MSANANGQTVKRFYTVKEFYELLGGIVGKSQVYKMIESGEIPTRKIGNKIVMSADWVNAYLNQPCIAVKKTKEKAM